MQLRTARCAARGQNHEFRGANSTTFVTKCDNKAFVLQTRPDTFAPAPQPARRRLAAENLRRRQDSARARWAHRFRHQVRFAVHFKKDAPWRLIVWDEVFFHLNETAFTTERGFDQNRAFVGLGYDTKPVRVEVGYINQYVRRSTTPTS
ncbi:Protein of unknown function [Nannocystis exedens]|uniref:Uncharacterized protein n=2 Tax=Nannocystis exedens TaxID=54 RepID=A0A1I2GTF2_9BACT|nr:DUF2490 domain-containing protein [Nannocystis exedens]PCC74100.1 hypothetical protein NAEX_07189 [Nannocystis exedens]SFF20752.1 Protein of unknown function [Nannocystis exedens]